MLSDRLRNIVDQLDKLADEGSLDISFFKHGISELRGIAGDLDAFEKSAGPGGDLITPVTGANLVSFVPRKAVNDDK